MTYADWLQQAEATPQRRQRRGQLLFNSLTRVRPDITGKIENTELDPFFDDQRIPAFLELVKESW